MGKALIVEIFGDAKQFAAELDKAAGKTRQMGRAAGVAGLALAGGLAFGLEASVKAAMEGQVSQTLLDQALKNTHQSVAAMKGPLQDAEAASRKLGFADDDTRTSLAKLETATGSTKKSIHDLGVAQDIARFKHIGLDSATKILTSTLAGNARAAKQLGIIVQPVTAHMDALKQKYKELGTAIPPAEAAQAKLLDKQATAASTIQAVTDKVHGQADAFSKTASGGMAEFHAQTKNLEESLGNALLPAVGQVTGKLAALAGFMAEHTTTAKVLVGVIGALAGILIAVSVATKIATAAQVLLDAAMDANPIGLVVLALGLLVAGFVIAWKHSETFRDIVKGAFDVVKKAGQDIANFFTRDIPAAFKAALDWLKGNWPAIAVIISGPFAPLVALATNAFGVRSAIEGAFHAVLTAVTTTVGAVVSAVTGAFSRAVAAIAGAVGDAVSAASSVGRGAVSGVKNGISGLVGAVDDKVGDVLAVIRAIPGRIVAALGNLSGLLFNAGSSIIGGLISGLESRLGEVEHLAGSIAGKIASLKGPIEYDRKLLVPHGQAIIEGLQSGMEGQLGGLYGSVSMIAPSIGSAVASGTPGLSGGGGGVTVNINAPNYVGSARDLSDAVVSALARYGLNTPSTIRSVLAS